MRISSVTSLDPNQASELWWQVDKDLFAVRELDLVDILSSRPKNPGKPLAFLQLRDIGDDVGGGLLSPGHCFFSVVCWSAVGELCSVSDLWRMKNGK